MTYDRALPELLREAVPVLTGREVCVVRDLQGRLRLVVESLDDSLRSSLEETLQRSLGGYFVGPILVKSNTTDKVRQRLAQAIWNRKTEWPATWPASIPALLSGDDQPLDTARWFALTKSLSKDEWLSSTPNPPWPHHERTPPIVSFYSYKGGVGRSTLLGCVAYALAKEGKKVCVLDLDLEAPGIGTLLGVQSNRGLLDVIIDHIATGTINLDDCSAKANSFDGLADKVTVFPAGTVTDWRYLEKLARLDFVAQNPVDNNGRSPVHNALKTILQEIQRSASPDVILIDSRAGLHDLGGLSLNALSHIEVLVARKSEQNYLGMELALQALARRDIHTLKCLLVHSFAPVHSAATYGSETAEFRERIYDLFTNHVYREPYPVPDRDESLALHYPQVFPHSDALAQASIITQSEVPDLTSPAMKALLERFQYLLRGARCD